MRVCVYVCMFRTFNLSIVVVVVVGCDAISHPLSLAPGLASKGGGGGVVKGNTGDSGGGGGESGGDGDTGGSSGSGGSGGSRAVQCGSGGGKCGALQRALALSQTVRACVCVTVAKQNIVHPTCAIVFIQLVSIIVVIQLVPSCSPPHVVPQSTL